MWFREANARTACSVSNCRNDRNSSRRSRSSCGDLNQGRETRNEDAKSWHSDRALTLRSRSLLESWMTSPGEA